MIESNWKGLVEALGPGQLRGRKGGKKGKRTEAREEISGWEEYDLVSQRQLPQPMPSPAQRSEWRDGPLAVPLMSCSTRVGKSRQVPDRSLVPACRSCAVGASTRHLKI